MANVKISELNELLGHQKSYDDVLPIVDTSANETKKISVKGLIPSNVKLIAITDTAPVEYETGDKYYNTTTDKIYTGTSLDWESPEDPVPDIFYVILDEQKTYTYDHINHEMISVGGGGGGGIAVYPDEAIEDTKLVIEEDDLSFQGGEITNAYSESTGVGYSANYINQCNTYSTSETNTGKKWIDGKDIYRKVFYASSLPNTSTLQISTGLNINNITIVKLEGIGQDGSNVFPLNCPASSSSASNWLRLFGNKSPSNELLVNIATGNDRSSYIGYVVLEYTKTS